MKGFILNTSYFILLQIQYFEIIKRHQARTFDNIHITGREQLIRSHSSARFCFELSGNSNQTKACNLNSDKNFELEIRLN